MFKFHLKFRIFIKKKSYPVLEKINPDFIKYYNKMSSERNFIKNKNGYSLGYIPAPVSLSHVRGKLDSSVGIQYPEKYDLRSLGETPG